MKNRSLWIYTLLGVALVITGVVAVVGSQAAQQSRAQVEAGYTLRLLEAQEHLQAAALELDKLAVMQTGSQQVAQLGRVLSHAEQTASALSALPLSHVAMSDTIKFCNQLADYAGEMMRSVAAGTPISESDAATLSGLKSQSQLLLGRLVTSQREMVDGGLLLLTNESVYYADAAADTRPIEAVADQDNGMEYPTLIYDGAFSDARFSREPKGLPQGDVQQEEAIRRAVAFVGEERVQSAMASVGAGGPIPAHGVTLTLNDGVTLQAEVTRQGGQVLWMMPEHASFPGGLTIEECEKAALSFLSQRGYGELQANYYQVYDGMAVINFVPVEGGVLLYPDLLKAQVRMDTGEVVGIEANNYLTNHVSRGELRPVLTPQDAQSRASKRLDIKNTRLCLIPLLGRERLCYELAGTMGEAEYRVYIDAKTGDELEVLYLIHTEGGTLAA